MTTDKKRETPRTDALEAELSKDRPVDKVTGTGRALALAGQLERELGEMREVLEELVNDPELRDYARLTVRGNLLRKSWKRARDLLGR